MALQDPGGEIRPAPQWEQASDKLGSHFFPPAAVGVNLLHRVGPRMLSDPVLRRASLKRRGNRLELR